ncbi:MAG: rhodanese-like domain-containing protein [Actinobacteria bacterium HGW-Actinobacteria-4]|nr:MAG: rhodanese-like domain-containing protein [Actinobacteria bacterium HGW-Actinobacteria-4]
MLHIPRRTASTALALLLAMTLAACSAPAEDAGVVFDGTHVAAAAFAEALDVPGVVVVDVRTPQEFAQGHLPGAVNIDVESPDFGAQVAALDLDAPHAIYCRSANRSQVALAIMAQAGHTQTLGLAGGIVAWPGAIVTD